MDKETTLRRYGPKGTPIGHVRGLGAAHEGTHHWLLQRFTAIGNLLTVGFLVVSLALLPNYDYATVAGWVSQPIPATALALMVVSTFWHARLGLQVMIEDYVDNSGNRFALFALINIAALGGGGFALFSIARLALAPAAGGAA